MTVMENNGITEADFSVVDLDEIREKELNIALNKAEGTWDDAKLAELLDDLGDKAIETGFSLPEIEALQSRIEDALDDDFLDDELGAIEETFNVTLEFPVEFKEELNAYIKANGKDGLVQMMIEEARKEE